MIGIQSQQILVPKSVYIGDTAELQCSININSPALNALTQNGEALLPIENFMEPLNVQDYEIKSVKLSPSGVDFYQFTITFVPWKTGAIQFPAYYIEGNQLDFEEITIVSLTEQNSITVLNESTAPLLLPGTTYKLYGILLLFLFFLILIIRVIVRHKQVMFFIKNLQLKRKYKKNAKKTRKKINLLLKSDLNAKDFSSNVQKIMRNYLEVRFEYPFTKTVTSELLKNYDTATSRLLAEEKNTSFEEIVSIFVRTDYLRYSNQAVFEEDEKQHICENLIKNIEVIESSVEEKENQNKKDKGGSSDV